MDIVKLRGATKDYLWGGSKLRLWGKEAPTPKIAESWELSFNDEGPSLIASGPNKRRLLKDLATKEDLGTVPASFRFFPVLIKLIDAAKDLSIQVHPSDQYALRNESQYGKTEMWYVIESEPGSGLYVGFKRPTSLEEVRSAVLNGTITSLLSFHEVKSGETYFIPSGTVHAIGKGVTLLEIQQNSTLTYRLYDYGRLDADGKPRPLHLVKALEVLDYEPYNPPSFTEPLIGQSSYFSSSVHTLKGEDLISASLSSFKSLTFVSEAEGTLDRIPFHKGDTFFVPASKKGLLKGSGTYVLTEVK